MAMIAEAFNKNGIEWYIVGSVGDALRGINVSPFDIDLVVFTGDFARVKATCYQNFPDSIIAPFTEHGYINPLKYFGRMFLAGAMVEIASDRIWDMDSRAQGFGRFVSPISGYESASWQGYAVNLEAVELRRQIEIARGRPDRVAAIEAFMEG